MDYLSRINMSQYCSPLTVAFRCRQSLSKVPSSSKIKKDYHLFYLPDRARFIWTRGAGMPHFHANSFRGLGDVVTLTFIKCPNIDNEISSLIHEFWQIIRYQLCTNFCITKIVFEYVMYSSFTYRQFNGIFMTCEIIFLPYERIHNRNCVTVDHNMRLPRVWQVQH